MAKAGRGDIRSNCRKRIDSKNAACTHQLAFPLDDWTPPAPGIDGSCDRSFGIKFMSMKKAAHSQENGRPLFSKDAFRSEATLPAVALSHPSLLLAPARVRGLAPAAAPDSRAQLVSFAQPFVVLLSSFFERAWLWTSPCDAIVTFSS